jgi:hypothetical protein
VERERGGLDRGLRASRAFDVKFYLEKYPDVGRANGNDYRKALEHWVTYGINEGRQGSYEVDVKSYLEKYPDLKKKFGTNYGAALNHFETQGILEGRKASAGFDVANYFNNYRDLRVKYRYTDSRTTYANDYTLGFLDWVKTGRKQGLLGTYNFRRCIDSATIEERLTYLTKLHCLRAGK